MPMPVGYPPHIYGYPPHSSDVNNNYKYPYNVQEYQYEGNGTQKKP